MTSFSDSILLACENILPRKDWLLFVEIVGNKKIENNNNNNKNFLGLPKSKWVYMYEIIFTNINVCKIENMRLEK